MPKRGNTVVLDTSGPDGDMELLEIIDEAITTCGSFVKALDKVLDFEKKHRGLRGIHISVDPFSGNKADSEKIAKEILAIHREKALGNAVDITDEIL